MPGYCTYTLADKMELYALRNPNCATNAAPSARMSMLAVQCDLPRRSNTYPMWLQRKSQPSAQSSKGNVMQTLLSSPSSQGYVNATESYQVIRSKSSSIC